MDTIVEIFRSETLLPLTVFFRLLLSLIIGTMIGLERELSRQPAGLRTHILICVGSTLVMLISIYLPQSHIGMPTGDPGRIAAQVVSGIGFLGAGAIVKMGANIRGLTTAASIWAIAALGLAAGSGMLLAALIGTATMLFVLIVIDYIERKILPGKSYKSIHISGALKMIATPFQEIMHKEKIQIITMEMVTDKAKNMTEYTFMVSLESKTNLPSVVEKLAAKDSVYKVEITDS